MTQKFKIEVSAPLDLNRPTNEDLRSSIEMTMRALYIAHNHVAYDDNPAAMVDRLHGNESTSTQAELLVEVTSDPPERAVETTPDDPESDPGHVEEQQDEIPPPEAYEEADTREPGRFGL